MQIYKVDGKLISSGAKFNAFIKEKCIAKYGHVIALEVLKRRAEGDKRDKQEIQAAIELELGGEPVEVN